MAIPLRKAVPNYLVQIGSDDDEMTISGEGSTGSFRTDLEKWISDLVIERTCTAVSVRAR